MLHKSFAARLMPVMIVLLAACSPLQISPTPQGNLPNPAGAYCEQQGNQLKIVTASDGSQSGVCIFKDGSQCDEWAYFRGACGPGKQGNPTPAPTRIPAARPVNPADYQGWWTYTHPIYNFSIMLPNDWIVENADPGDLLLKGHLLTLHPKDAAQKKSIRMTFRSLGEETLLWPTGVGQGEFVAQGSLDVAGQASQRVLLVCPGGEVTSIWYHQDETRPNITRGSLEFGFIFNAAAQHCQAGSSLGGEPQHIGEMIIASLKVP